jgi:BirA family transcriptional regulator, biotin operon repressor / biotin---[acetyl-CoA-carboxylase] ligase
MMQAEDDTPVQADPADRAALDAAVLRRAVIRPGGLWRAVEVLASTGSTNAGLLARAAAGAPEGAVLAAEEQTAGRGRLGRSWVSPPRAALTFSLLVRPETVAPARRGWLPLLTGVSVASAVRAAAGVDARLKWPNDVLAGPAKLGGILAEATGDAIVIGIGLNVSTEPGELPPPGPIPGGTLPATSLRVLGVGSADRDRLLIEILAAFEHRYQAWRQAGGDPDRCGLRAEYTALCATIGRRVRVELPGDQLLSGLAVGVDPDGRLLVRVSDPEDPEGPDAEVRVAAGDVVHLR